MALPSVLGPRRRIAAKVSSRWSVCCQISEAPISSGRVIMPRYQWIVSMSLDASVAKDLCPSGALGPQLSRALVRRIADRLEAKRGHALLDLRQRQHLDDLAMQQRDDVLWRSGWNDEGKPMCRRPSVPQSQLGRTNTRENYTPWQATTTVATEGHSKRPA